jgi:hypothetical protein
LFVRGKKGKEGKRREGGREGRREGKGKEGRKERREEQRDSEREEGRKEFGKRGLLCTTVGQMPTSKCESSARKSQHSVTVMVKIVSGNNHQFILNQGKNF